MLCMEADAFSRDDEAIGCIEELQLNINLADSRLVQKNYRAIPRPIKHEVKH